MIRIEPFGRSHLLQVQTLLNTHLSALVPGWSLPAAYIAGVLRRNPREYVTDPWVVERATLCAVERARVVAAAHLLRYGAGAEVGGYCQNAGEIDWFVAYPGAVGAADALLAAVQQQCHAWQVGRVWAQMGALVGPFVGVPDAAPHLAAALVRSGFRREPGDEEAVYGGALDRVPPAGAPPLPGMALRRTVGGFGVRFSAVLEGETIGVCECVPDLTEGGALPALRGWAELSELEVEPVWRNCGVGAWLIGHAVDWLRLGRCERLIFAVAPDSEAAGVERFYGRCGWRPLVREQKGWRW
ncbi:MAG TPA: GNAT family N-acetyltransferase [Roseiflexaceae bacterium]|nr:GNAT family N-acetyltransferase [Roseiflexaceae bacterium]